MLHSSYTDNSLRMTNVCLRSIHVHTHSRENILAPIQTSPMLHASYTDNSLRMTNVCLHSIHVHTHSRENILATIQTISHAAC